MQDQRIAYLYETVRAGSIRAAADRLNVNASSISRQIAMLEQETAVALLERLPRGVRPTEAGRMLIDYHLGQQVARADVLARIHELNNLVRGTVQFVLGEGFISDFLSDALRDFCRKHPTLSYSIETMATDAIVRAVIEDDAQIGLVFNPPFDPRLSCNARIDSSIRAIVPRGHPLACLGHAPSLRELASFPSASLNHSFGVQHLIGHALQIERLSMPVIMSTNSFTLLRNFVVSGLGIALLPEFVAMKEVREGLVEAIPISNATLMKAEIHLITRRGRQLPPSALSLLGHLRSYLNSFKNR